MVIFLINSFLNRIVLTPEIAFTTVDLPCATWPMVPMLMVACLEITSGVSAVRREGSKVVKSWMAIHNIIKTENHELDKKVKCHGEELISHYKVAYQPINSLIKQFKVLLPHLPKWSCLIGPLSFFSLTFFSFLAGTAISVPPTSVSAMIFDGVLLST